MLNILIGCECGDLDRCDKRDVCKYRRKYYNLHNWSIYIHEFFEKKLHIQLPYLVSIDQKWERLSGTDKCPYHKSRNYTCYDCKFVGGELLRDCYCTGRINTDYKNQKPDIEIEDWGKRCAYFEKCEWADDYLKK